MQAAGQTGRQKPLKDTEVLVIQRAVGQEYLQIYGGAGTDWKQIKVCQKTYEFPEGDLYVFLSFAGKETALDDGKFRFLLLPWAVMYGGGERIGSKRSIGTGKVGQAVGK